VRSLYRFSTFTSPTLNYLHDEWYRNGTSDIKRVPLNIENNLTPLALACWAQDDGTKVGDAFKFCTNAFPKEDIELLAKCLLNRYNIKATVQSAGADNQ